MERWDEVWRRNQFLVRELLAGHPNLRVLFVEPAIDLAHDLRRGRIPHGLGLHVAEGRGRLWTFRPMRTFPRTGHAADVGLCRQVVRASKRLGFEAPTVWINDSVYAPLPESTGWASVYDITDDWLLAEAPPKERVRRIEREWRLLDTADRVVVCSPSLAASRGKRRKVELIGNAVDAEHFRHRHLRPVDMPDGPTAVYVGTLHDERVDVDLLVRVASESVAQIVLVGPNCLSDASTARLVQLPNVHLLGPRPYEQVPAYLQHADVVVIPHVVSPFTETLDPIKAYECAVVGRPTLATPVAGFRDMGGPVRCVSAALFPGVLADWIRQPPDVDQAPEPPTWSSRAAAFAAVLADAGRRHGAEPGRGVATAAMDPQRIRVAFVDHCARLSGAELALIRLLPALEGVDVHVVLAEDGPLISRLADCGATVEVLPLEAGARGLPRHNVGWRILTQPQTIQSAIYVIRLARRLRQLRPDVVHTYSLKAALYGGLAAKLVALPLVWHIHDRIADDYLPEPAVRLVRGLARLLPDAIITNSEATASTLGGRGRWRSSQRRAVIHYPVPAVTSVRESHGDLVRIGMVGRISPWKGQHVFLEALALAFCDGDVGDGKTSWEAVIVGAALFGEESYEKELHDLTTKLGLDDRVAFLGFREAMAEEFAKMDVLVHASVLPEPFGQVVAEGMAAGVPVIAAAAGGPVEIIDDGVTGLLCPPGDVAALAAAIRRLTGDADLRGRLARAAIIRAGDFSPSIIAGQVTDLYRLMLVGKKSPLRALRRHPTTRNQNDAGSRSSAAAAGRAERSWPG